MDFNHRIVKNILNDLRKTISKEISLGQLKTAIDKHTGAVDSTFPKEIWEIIAGLNDLTTEQEQRNYAANLNTDEEGSYDSDEHYTIFDGAIAALQSYLDKAP